MDNGSQTSASQFRPMVPNPAGQPFHPSSQQFPPVGQGIPPPNVGMPPAHSQPLQFSQPMQQYPPRPGHAVHPMPSSQGVPMSYIQTRPVAPGPPPSQQPAPPFNNQMPGLAGAGMPYSSSYSFAPPSFAHPQNNANSLSQFPPMSQMQAPLAPGPGQPWLSSGSQGAPAVTPVQQVGQQPAAASLDNTTNVSSLSQQSSSDWQEHSSADGRRYYYNKRTKQSVWDKPLELMTPIEMSWQVWRNFTTAPICSI